MTYGQIVFKSGTPRGCYLIRAQPHVVMRIKRLFARADVAHALVKLADTAEVGRDLAWVCERYPLEMDAQTRLRLEARAHEHRERERVIAAALAGHYEPPPGAVELALPLRDYQRVAAGLALKTGRLLIGDMLGLGKTASAIGVLTDRRALPALVVTKTDLPKQWEREVHRFAPSLRTHILRGTRPYRLDHLDFGVKRRSAAEQGSLQGTAPSMPDVIITSYSKLAPWAEKLAGQVRTVIWDECQELRTGLGTAAKQNLKNTGAALIASMAQFKVGLSGTPIYGYGEEFWNVFQAIAPEALGTREEFIREWCVAAPGNKYKVKDERAFGTYLRDEGLFLRRTRKDVRRELPAEPVFIPVEIDADLDTLRKVEAEVEGFARILLSGGVKGFDKMEAARELDWRLREATGVAKAPHVATFVKALAEEEGEKVVLFGWHHRVYEIWAQRLAELQPVFFTGRESQAQKQAALSAFIDGNSKVLIMSLRAGAGIDGLQHVSHISVFGELDWSPGVMEQCVGRQARDGQEDVVLPYVPYCTHGSDPIVMDVLGMKRQQVELTIDPNRPTVENLPQFDPEHVKKLAASILAKRGGVVGVDGMTGGGARR